MVQKIVVEKIPEGLTPEGQLVQGLQEDRSYVGGAPTWPSRFRNMKHRLPGSAGALFHFEQHQTASFFSIPHPPSNSNLILS